MKVCAGIILYDPDVERLKLSLEAVRTQVDRVVFVNNASGNASNNADGLRELFSDSQYVWISNEENLGIAKALNQLVEFADSNGYEWILTLDQDSICEDGMVQKMLAIVEAEERAVIETGESAVVETEENAFAEGKKIAMVAPFIVDRGVTDKDEKSGKPVPDSEDIKFCITSGCLTRVEAIVDTGGFNEWLFVYDVDREICIRLLRRGYRLVRVNNTKLYHEHGTKTVYRRLLWKRVVYHNYSPFSVYYMTRNLVFMLRKYGSEYAPRPFFRWVRLFFAFCVKFIFESDRIQRLKAYVKGLRDGFSVKISES